jgi:PST family polysaccharide transporter
MRSPIAWSAFEAGVAGGLSLLSAITVARLIGPAELGVGAAAVAVHVVLWVAVNALFADAVVQRATMDDATLSAAFWSGLAVGTLALAIEAVSGPILAWAYQDERLSAMALVLAVPLPLVGCAGVQQGRLTRALAYRALALRTLLGQGCGTLAGIGAALAGAGAWAMVVQQTVVSLAGAATLMVVAGWRPALFWRWEPVRRLLAVGVPLTASTLLQIARYRLFALLIGAFAGAAVLGQVHMAFRLVDTVRDLTFTALWRLFLPDLSRFQDDPAAMLARIDRLLSGVSLLVLPACGVLAVSLGWCVAVILGPHWQAAAQAAVPLVGLMGLLALTFPSGVALVALGQARFTLYGNVIGLIAGLGGAAALRPQDAWQAVLIWCGAQTLVMPYALWVNGRALGVGPWRPLRAGAAMGLATTAVAALLLLVVPAFSGT